MTEQAVAAPEAQAPPRRGLVRAAAIAGLVGPILFTVAFVVQGLLRVGEHDPVAEPVSALEVGPFGWVQQVNFVVFGLLTIGFALGLHATLRPARAGWVGPALLTVSALAMLWAAAFPIREAPDGSLVFGLHPVGGATYFATAAIALVVLSRRLARDPAWRRLAGYVLASGLAGLAAFLASGILVQPDAAPLHPWAGVVQRVVIVAVLFPPTVVLAWRMLRRARP